jgi:hypothetical protein
MLWAMKKCVWCYGRPIMEEGFHHCYPCLLELSERNARWFACDTGGQCLECRKRPRVEGKSRCRRCLAMKADNMARRRAELALEGRCTECATHLNPEESRRNHGLKQKVCEACRAKKKGWQRGASERRKHGWVPIHRAWHRRPKHGPMRATHRGTWVSANCLLPGKEARGRIYLTQAKRVMGIQ